MHLIENTIAAAAVPLSAIAGCKVGIIAADVSMLPPWAGQWTDPVDPVPMHFPSLPFRMP